MRRGDSRLTDIQNGRKVEIGVRSMSDEDQRVEIDLFGGFEVRIGGEPCPLAPAVERLVAYLAIQHRNIDRRRVAGTLWPDTSETKATASLRSALWRTNRDHPLIDSCSARLSLCDDVRVDLWDRLAWADSVRLGTGLEAFLPTEPYSLSGELLSDWYDDWVIIDRERVRQVTLQALETLAHGLLGEDRFGAALQAALSAIYLEPLRETSHAAAIDAHLAAGNVSEAQRHLDWSADLLRTELGIEPAPELQRRIDGEIRRRQAGAESRHRPVGRDTASLVAAS